jgi:hypothetical protein
MLVKAERKQDFHLTKIQEGVSKSDKIKHMRNYKALQGVIKALKWTLGDENINQKRNEKYE